MADQKLPRREREKLRQRREMLAAALDLFSQKGYHNVSMQEIAEKAEFAIGTLYKFFQSKEDLYKTMVLERCDDFDRGLHDGHGPVRTMRRKNCAITSVSGVSGFATICPLCACFWRKAGASALT